MIALLRGQLVETSTESAILDVSGVGYELQVSANTLNDISLSSSDVQMFVYTHVREDALQLFGFSKKMEKELFLALIKVNGIGPKMALKILSGASVEHLVQMIEQEDTTALSRLPKVGKKTAEQMILTLKGKLVMEEGVTSTVQRKDIVSALVHLGFKLNDVEKVVSQMSPQAELEEGVRKGLALLTNL